MSYFDNRYYYEIHGVGQPLVLLHGFTGSVESWYPFLEKLTQHHQVILMDLLGHGKTISPPDPAPYQMEQAAQDLALWLDDLALGAKIILLGYSMGGRLALYFALHYPHWVSHLILESASAGLQNGHAERIAHDLALAERIEREGVEAFLDDWEKMPLFQTQSEAVKQNLRKQRRHNSAIGLANSLRGMGTGVQPNLWGELPHLQPPTTLLVGEWDSKFLAINQRMADLIPEAHLQIISRAGHIIHAEQPAAFLASLSKPAQRDRP